MRDYTLVLETSGVRDTVHFRRDTVGGMAVFVPVTGLGADLPRRETQDPYALLSVLSSENAELAGRENVDGESCHVIGITRFDHPALRPFFGPLISSGIASPERMEVFLDADQHLPRRVSFRGTMSMGADTLPMTYTVEFRDYREVGGLAHPFLTRSTVAVELPEEAGPTPTPLPGRLDATVRVLELRVNEGPPAGPSRSAVSRHPPRPSAHPAARAPGSLRPGARTRPDSLPGPRRALRGRGARRRSG